MQDESVDLSQKPFLGVPFTLKEHFDMAGTLNTLGLYFRRNYRSTYMWRILCEILNF